MKDLKRMAYKLQTALFLQGCPVSIEEKHFFSVKYHRPVTRYMVRVKRRGERPETIIETYSAAELVKALAERLREEQRTKA